jgi:hypothetical protein
MAISCTKWAESAVSVGRSDPWAHLAAAVLLQAIRDFQQSKDTLSMLGASLFLIENGRDYAGALGFEIEPAERWEVLIANL